MSESARIDIPRIDVQIESEDARDHPIIAAVTQYWASLSGGTPPPRSQFDFMAIYKAAPYLLMSERVAPRTFRFIYCGTQVAENFPLDLTGKTFGPDNVEASRIPWFEYKSQSLDQPCVRYGCDELDWPSFDFDTILSGVFPMTDDEGVLKHPLACLVFLNRGAI